MCLWECAENKYYVQKYFKKREKKKLINPIAQQKWQINPTLSEYVL